MNFSILQRCALAGTFLLAGAALPAFAADVEPLPTQAELHKDFDAGMYQPLLAKLSRVLQLKGEAARPYDRIDLEMLKGNTLIEMKQQVSAITAFEDAVKSTTDQTPPKQAAEAVATRALLKKSPSLTYTPKGSAGVKGTPISLLDLSQRKEAFTALFTDAHAEVAAKAKAAASSKSLAPIIAGMNSIAELRAIEMMATDSDKSSQELVGQLAAQAGKLMEEAVKSSEAREKVLNENANKLIANPAPPTAVPDPKSKTKGHQQPVQPTVTTYHKAGLTSNSMRELKDIIDTNQKIESASKDFEAVSKEHAATFKTIATAADKTAKTASDTLSADYAGNFAK